MPQLWEIAKLVRSKNAGPFMLTVDIMFADRPAYAAFRSGPLADPELYARLYGVSREKVQLFFHDTALAAKVSFPRPVPSGSTEDRDVFGGQFHSLLVELSVDDQPGPAPGNNEATAGMANSEGNV